MNTSVLSMIYFIYINKKDRAISYRGEMTRPFVAARIYSFIAAFAEIKKGGITPLEIIPTLCIKPLLRKEHQSNLRTSILYIEVLNLSILLIELYCETIKMKCVNVFKWIN